MSLRPLHRSATFVALAALTLLAGCAWPSRDPAVLKAIRAESELLMATWPADRREDVPQARWPRTIAQLEPEWVRVTPQGVDILVKAQMDGGWGYFVAPRHPTLGRPGRPMTDLGDGVYWYAPY
jgi:hypothetical protein